jgi:predicted outer membrane repeat protein
MQAMAMIDMIVIIVLMSTLTTLSGSVESLTPHSQVKYVHPSNSSVSCNVSEPCTFNQYANDPEQHFLSNINFVFLAGDHQLNTSIDLHGIQNVSFQGMPTDAEGSVTVILGPQVDLSFSSCDDIEIISLNFLLSGEYVYRLIFYNTNSVNLRSIVIRIEDENSTGNSSILSQASTINISDSSFVGISGQFGAALQCMDSSEITLMGNVNFTNNSAKLGGAIHSTCSQLQFTGTSIFTDNVAHINITHAGNDIVNSDEDRGIGGAVYANSSQIIMRGCTTFSSNMATIHGGAFAAVNNSTVVINGSSCSSNGSRSMGIVFNSNQIEEDLGNYVFYPYYRSGGALYTNNSEVKIENTYFLNNFSPEDGGAASFIQSNVTIYNINAANNVARYAGGAISFFTSTRAQIGGENRFVNNSAYDFGGAIGFYYVQSVSITGVNYFEGNSAYYSGGAFGLYFVTKTVAIICGEIIFTNNNATNGGAICVSYNSILNSTGRMKSINNNATNGGAIYVSYNSTLTSTGRMEYINNNATNGGAIYVTYNSTLNSTGSMEFKNNIARFGGAIFMTSPDITTVYFLDYGDTNFTDNMAIENGGAVSSDRNGRIHFHRDITILFQKNHAGSCGGAIYIENSLLTTIGNMEHRNNSAGCGGAIFVRSTTVTYYCYYDGNVIYGNCTFIDNEARENGGAISSDKHSQVNFYGDTMFKNNRAEGYGGGIYSLNSRISYISADYVFEGNSAGYGGAIAIFGNAKMIINPQVEIMFIENKAHYVGGAIFVDIYTSSTCLAVTTELDTSNPDCFIMLNTCYDSFDNSQLILNFTNNIATNSGNVLYGGSLNQCTGLFKSNAECGISMTDQNQESAFDIIVNVSSISPENSSYTEFSSNPSSLCIFNESSNNYCGSPMPVEVFPGGTFNVIMQAVDQYDHILDGVEVKSAQDNSGDYRIRINTESDPITTNSSCPNLTFQVLVYDEDLVKNGSKLRFSLHLDLEGQCTSNYTNFDIIVKPCPFGFELSPDIRKCSCAKQLQKFTEDCKIESITIGRSSNTVWMNFSTDSILLRDGGCPLDYCNNKQVYIPQNNSDVQCNDGRTGKLCGSCIHTEFENNSTEHYSLVLGTLTCKQNCSHTHLLLILPIGFLGILLIVVLFMLRLTVAAGTINGLLFYANIVQANHQTFLPTDTTNPLKYFYTIFLGWLNLDFSIETCFYDGMDIYAYSWFQFLFPVYLWVLMFIIILSARYSQRVAHNLGQNPVAVLATVLLISYGKMLKAIIVPLSSAELQIIAQENPNTINDTEIVWLYNGNISYSDRDHIVLVVFACLVLLFLFLPYSFLLLCGHWLQAKSHWRILSWINKLKPFMDAYHAPYKKNNRHWIGLFLLARCGLFLTFAFNATGLGGQHLNLLIITSVTAILSIIKGRVYEKWYNDFLESSFLLNLSLLSVVTFYVQSDKSPTDNPQDITDNQIIVSTVSVGIAFVFFIGIMVFHTRQRMKDLDLFSFFRSVCMRCKLRLIKKSNKMVDKEQSMEVVTKSSVCLRELLLGEESQS